MLYYLVSISISSFTWRSKAAAGSEVAQPRRPRHRGADDAKPEPLRRYLDRWFWEVKGSNFSARASEPTPRR